MSEAPSPVPTKKAGWFSRIIGSGGKSDVDSSHSSSAAEVAQAPAPAKFSAPGFAASKTSGMMALAGLSGDDDEWSDEDAPTAKPAAPAVPPPSRPPPQRPSGAAPPPSRPPPQRSAAAAPTAPPPAPLSAAPTARSGGAFSFVDSSLDDFDDDSGPSVPGPGKAISLPKPTQSAPKDAPSAPPVTFTFKDPMLDDFDDDDVVTQPPASDEAVKPAPRVQSNVVASPEIPFDIPAAVGVDAANDLGTLEKTALSRPSTELAQLPHVATAGPSSLPPSSAPSHPEQPRSESPVLPPMPPAPQQRQHATTQPPLSHQLQLNSENSYGSRSSRSDPELSIALLTREASTTSLPSPAVKDDVIPPMSLLTASVLASIAKSSRTAESGAANDAPVPAPAPLAPAAAARPSVVYAPWRADSSQAQPPPQTAIVPPSPALRISSLDNSTQQQSAGIAVLARGDPVLTANVARILAKRAEREKINGAHGGASTLIPAGISSAVSSLSTTGAAAPPLWPATMPPKQPTPSSLPASHVPRVQPTIVSRPAPAPVVPNAPPSSLGATMPRDGAAAERYSVLQRQREKLAAELAARQDGQQYAVPVAGPTLPAPRVAPHALVSACTSAPRQLEAPAAYSSMTASHRSVNEAAVRDSDEARALYGLLSSSLRATAPSTVTPLEAMSERLRMAAAARAKEKAAAAASGSGDSRERAAFPVQAVPSIPPFSNTFAVSATNDEALGAALRLPADRSAALAAPALKGASVRLCGWRGTFCLYSVSSRNTAAVAIKSAPKSCLLAALETLSLLPVPTRKGPSGDLTVSGGHNGHGKPALASLVRSRSAHLKVRTAEECGAAGGGACLSWIVGSDATPGAIALTGQAPLYALRSCGAVGDNMLSLDFFIGFPLEILKSARDGPFAQLEALLKVAGGGANEWPGLAIGEARPTHAAAAVAMTLSFEASSDRDDWSAALAFLASIEAPPLGSKIDAKVVFDPPLVARDTYDSGDEYDHVTAAVERASVSVAMTVANIRNQAGSVPVTAAPIALRAASQFNSHSLPAALAAVQGAFDVHIDADHAARLAPLLSASRGVIGPPSSDSFSAPPILYV